VRRDRTRPLDGGVGRHDPGHAGPERHVDGVVEGLIGEVRRELHRERLRDRERPGARRAGCEQPLQGVALL
jgi:hypothetical protein